jgi:peptide/nickel transport system ATP-binding protein
VTTQAQILNMFKELRRARDAGIMFVTHDFGVVAEIADKVVVMQRGRVVEQGPASEILNRPQHPYTRLLIDAVPRRTPAAQMQKEARPIALRVSGVGKTFQVARTLFKPARQVAALKPVEFTMQTGETLGIVGESGSGKTTLVRCLIRLLDPDGGEVWIGNTDFAAQPRGRLRSHRKDIQIVFQDPYGSLNPRRRIGDQLVEGPINFGEARDSALKRARELMRIVRMDEDSLDRYPVQFSGGQRQRICIARALMVQPKILIADEAVSALDVSVQKEVLTLLADIKRQFGLSLLFITHDLRVAAQICDNIIVMGNGEIVERGAVDEVFGSPKHAYTQQLLQAMPGKDWQIPQVSG